MPEESGNHFSFLIPEKILSKRLNLTFIYILHVRKKKLPTS